MSRTLRSAVLITAVVALGAVAASCAPSVIEVSSKLNVGDSASVRVLTERGSDITNWSRCQYSLVPAGVVRMNEPAAGGSRTVTALAEGTTSLEVKCGTDRTGVRITVTRPVESLTVTPAVSVAKGLKVRPVATATYRDGGTADVTARAEWSVGNPSVATTAGSSKNGDLTGVAPGTTTFRAAFGGASATGTITVGPATLQALTISPITGVAAGETAQFQASAAWSDGTVTDQTAATTWATSDPGVLMVDTAPGSNGRAFGVTAGQATVTGSWAGKSASILVTVTGTLQSISMTPSNVPFWPPSSLFEMTVTGSYVGPSGPYDRVVTRWATITPPSGFTVVRDGDRASVITAPSIRPFATVQASLGGRAAQSLFEWL